MTYLGQLRMVFSFIPHDDPELWDGAVVYLNTTVGPIIGQALFVEWTSRGGTPTAVDMLLRLLEET